MKVKNLNNSSVKTRKLIKDTFIQMLSEKNELSKITVTALVGRANISRATFYAHFDSIYAVVEEFEEELVDKFFTNAKLLATNDYEKFFEAMCAFMEENDKNYRMLGRTNDLLYSVTKLSQMAITKLLELINDDDHVINREFVELDISVFVNGMLTEYIKYCRGGSNMTPKTLKEFSMRWYKRFVKERCR